ncbi:hypothetical protein BDW71DRAFT_90009 [Aspergillus fruticulosus]
MWRLWKDCVNGRRVTDIRNAYCRTGEPYSDGNPHVMCGMIQHSSPTNLFIRTEVLTIMSIMITRLRVQSVREHRVMPVGI